MPETGFRPLQREERSSFGQMVHTGRQGVRLVRARPALLAILGIAAFAGMWSEGIRPPLAGPLPIGLAGVFWIALLAYFVVGVARNVANPVFATWLNRNVGDSSVRATVLSITNQADAVGQWTGGPAIGLIGNVFSIRAALVAGGLCMAPALALYGRAIRHSGAEPELEDKT